MKTKICSRCGKEKPLDRFRKDSFVCRNCDKTGYPETMKELFRKTGQPELIYLLDSFGDTPMNDIVTELRNRGYRGSAKQMAMQMFTHDKGIKKCPRCNEYKPIGEFYKSSRSRCKTCENAADAEYKKHVKMKNERAAHKMEEIKKLADKCKKLRIRKILSGC